MISIVCYFLLFSVVFAFDMYISNGSDYDYTTNSELIVNNTYYFEYHLDELLMMDIVLKNKAPNATAAVYVTRMNASLTYRDTEGKNMTQCDDGDCLGLHDTELKTLFIYIGMQVNRGQTMLATHVISRGSAILSNTTSKNNLCLKPGNCVLVIDLQNERSEDSTGHQSSSPSPLTHIQKNMYIYAISAIVVLCVTILIIYLSVKKFRNRSSGPEDTLELNTYATRNEVLYADLNFMQGNSQPPRNEEEESPYAQIVGVLHPK